MTTADSNQPIPDAVARLIEERFPLARGPHEQVGPLPMFKIADALTRAYRLGRAEVDGPVRQYERCEESEITRGYHAAQLRALLETIRERVESDDARTLALCQMAEDLADLIDMERER